MTSRWRGRALFIAGIAVVAALAGAAIALDRRGHRSDDAGPRPIASAEVGLRAGGSPVPPSFLGFSWAYQFLPTLNAISRPNRPFAGLQRTMARVGEGVPAIRIGGKATDFTWFNPTGAPWPPKIYNDITPQMLAGLADTVRTTGSRLILGLNLGANDPRFAVDWARAALGGLPRGSILSFELGNEPDAFPQSPQMVDASTRRITGYMRSPDYSMSTYLGEFDRFAAALAPVLRGRLLAGPGFCCADGIASRLGEFLTREASKINRLTFHHYATTRCGHRPGQPGYPTVATMLSNEMSTRMARYVQPWVQEARRYELPVRITEMNSISCGGVNHVSNAFVAALWGVDTFFELARVGVSGVNLHGADALSYYTPTFFSRDGSLMHAQPLTYGMLMFGAMTRGGARLLPVDVRTERNVKIWATLDRRGEVRVAVLYKQRKGSGVVEVNVGQTTRPASVTRLTAPNAEASTGVRWGGQAFAAPSADGLLVGRRAREVVRPSAPGVYRVRVAAPGAAMLTIPPR